jgi:hypothetical protein
LAHADGQKEILHTAFWWAVRAALETLAPVTVLPDREEQEDAA